MWAEAALTGDMGAMPADSLDVLEGYLGHFPDAGTLSVEEAVWQASGIPALLTALGERISQGSALHAVDRIRRRAQNLTNETRAVLAAQTPGATAGGSADLGGLCPIEVVKDIAIDRGKALGALCDQLHNDLLARMERAQDDFVKRATDSLVNYCEQYGEQGTWTYDPAGLRVLHRSAYASFARQLKSQAGQLLSEAVAEVETVYRAVLGDQLENFHLEAPALPQVPAPVSLGKTLALDLHGNWWRRWWQKRRGFDASASEYAHLIRAETQSIIMDLIQSQVPEVLEECRSAYNEFMHEQIEIIGKLSQGSQGDVVTSFSSAPAFESAEGVCAGILENLDRKIA